MKWLYELWDKKIRTFIIVSFIGFLLLLVVKHYSDEIRYQEALQKYYIQDSLEIELDNGFIMTIYKQDEKTTDSTTATLINNTDR